MIAAGEPQVYIPHGKLVLDQYESATSFQRISTFNVTSPEQEDFYHLSTMEGESEEEEIYIHDNNVIWSRGCGDVYWELVKKFTFEGVVQQALWFDFDENPNRLACGILAPPVVKTTGRKIQSLCIVERSKITVHTRDGDEYACSVPYEIQRVWPTKFGLVFEKCSTGNPEIPHWFSLNHPLDEIVPVALRDGAERDHVNFARDKKLKLVFTSANPSICVTFNEDTGLHSIWLIRKAEVDESLLMGVSNKGAFNPNQSAFSDTFIASKVASPSLSRSFAFSQMFNTSLQHSPANLTSIFNNTGKATPKFDADSPRFNTPKASKSFAHHFGISSVLNQSKVNGSPLQRKLGSSRMSAILARTPLPSPSVSSLFNETEHPADEELLLPDLCMQILWTEDAKRTTHFAASKCFIAVDWLGKSSVCWLLEEDKVLRCIDLKVTENRSTGNPLYICCSPWVIPARDAEYLPALKAVLVLDASFAESNSLTLYSGSTKLAKVHVPNCSPINGTGISMSMQRLSLEAGDRRSLTSRFVPSTPLNSSRRSSLMHADLRDTSVTLSPIPTSAPMPTFRALQDPVGRQVTIKYSDRSLVRTTLPPLATSVLVERCLCSLRAALPPDIYMAIATRFYCARNAPGPADFSPPAEFASLRLSLLTLLGFDAKTVDGAATSSAATSPVVESKKSRTNHEEGVDDDWNSLLNSQYAKTFSQQPGLSELLPSPQSSAHTAPDQRVHVNNDSAHFSYMPHVLLVLHLLYEELKLDCLLWDDAQLLSTLLIPLASALNLGQYCELYWRDFPVVWSRSVKLGVISLGDTDRLMPLVQRIESPPNIYALLLAMMKGKRTTPYPHVKQVNARSRDLVTLYAILFGRLEDNNLVAVHDYVRDFDWNEATGRPLTPVHVVVQSRAASAVLKMSSCGWTLDDISNLPAGLGLALRQALFVCRTEPPTDWPDEAYRLVNRLDMCQSATVPSPPASSTATIPPALNLKSEAHRSKASGTKDDSADDGMQDVMELPIWKLLFPRDHRIQEVRRLLCSSRPVPVVLPASQQQGLTEHELIEEREKQLMILCIRIMSLSVGRGMFTLHTATPTVTETLPIPKLCLTGKTPHNGAAVDMTHIDVPSNMSLWPQFHNGVAAGLRVSPKTRYVDGNWNNFNRDNRQGATPVDWNPEAAGYLLGLGLTGHLNKFNDLAIHDHLNCDHEMTQLALVLGLGIGKRGSMDAGTLRIISVYIESLSPSSSGLMGCASSIEVPQNVRVSALMSIGLLYQGSAHRYMTEVFLGEIDRPPGPEMDNCVDRESYSLAAGLALGMVTLGQGGQMAGLADLRLADTLYHFMVGGTKRNDNSAAPKPRNVTSSASYQIREGSTVNVDVTAPGAILALGLMFHRTNNSAVAQWMAAPDSQQLLDSIRPDFLLLRTLARGLIMWDQVKPTRDWVESNVPPNIRRYSLRNPGAPDDGQSQRVDYETMNQAFYNIMAGACFALGLKFAGSANSEAYTTLHRYTKVLISLSGRSVAEWAGKATLEACLNVLLLSLSMVMVGTGDLEVLRLCRHLRMRTGSNNIVTYGSHMATHMALGFLYYGGGRLSLGTTPEAIAALVCACYPKFPIHSNDNRYHLQALRHLHVLAAQPRLLMPLEMPDMRPCYTNIQVVFTDEAGTFQLRAPRLLPELRFLQRVQVLDPRYRSVVFDRQHNWNKLERILRGEDHLVIQRKAGCLSYTEDPTGLASLATPTLSAWAIQPTTVANFTTDKFVLFLCRHFLGVSADLSTAQLPRDAAPLDTPLRLLSLVLSDCVVNEKTELVQPWLQLLHVLADHRSTLSLWQLKFLFSSPIDAVSSFINPEMVLALKYKLEAGWDTLADELRSGLIGYLSGRDSPCERHHQIAELAVYFDLPILGGELNENPSSLLDLLSDHANLAARLAVLLFI